MGLLRDLSRPRGGWRVWDWSAAQAGGAEAAAALHVAKQAFAERIGSGGRAVAISRDSQITRIEAFEPAADLIVFVPRLSGPGEEVSREPAADASSPWALLPPDHQQLPPELVLRRFALSQLERDELDKTHFLSVHSRAMPDRRLYVPLEDPFVWVCEFGRPVRLLEVRLEREFAPIDAVIVRKLAILADEEDVYATAESFSFEAASPAILRVLYKLVQEPPHE